LWPGEVDWKNIFLILAVAYKAPVKFLFPHPGPRLSD
jgi:hypothetical protein